MKGMTCSIYRDAKHGSCTNHGVTQDVNEITLTGPGIPEMREPHPEMPELRLMLRRNELIAVPIIDGEPKCGMFGGNFIYTCDSRFPAGHPIRVHDRFE